MYNDFKDTVFTVKELNLITDCDDYNEPIWDIKVKEPHGYYSLTTQMFELAEPKKTSKQKSVKEYKTSKKCKFKVGDKVRIRSWDDMAKEFEIIDDCLEVPFHFNRSMEKEIGGKVFTIAEIVDDSWCGSIVNRIRFKEPCYWNISEQMCELAELKKETEEKSVETTKVEDSSFFTEEEQVKILNALEVIIHKIKGD